MALHPEEEKWLGLLREGNEEGYRALLKQFQHKVYRTAMGFLGDEEEANDLAQEVFITVFEKVKDFRGDSSLSTWIYRIAVTKSLDRIKAGKRQKRAGNVISLFDKEGRLETKKVPDFRHPGLDMEDQEKYALLMKAIRKLPESQQTAITLFHFEQLSYKEVAGVMQTSEKAVESLLSRAKAGLREQLNAFRENLR